MTSEEIKAAIVRLRECDNRTLPTIFDAFTYSLLGKHWCNNDVIEAIVVLLEQADPDTHMELPVDADGVPIHIGDELEGAVNITEGERDTVRGFERSANGGYEWICDRHMRHECKWWRHYHKPTIEELLREFASEWFDVDDDSSLVAEYADKLRELVKEEQQ